MRVSSSSTSKSTRESKVSVIVPWHNTACVHLKKALTSVVRQEPGLEIEIVICDDGSSHASRLELSRLLSTMAWGDCTYDVVRHSDRRGIAAARNSAVSRASGEWLLWLDADDELQAGAVASLIANGRPSQPVVISQCEVLGPGGSAIHDPSPYLSLALKHHASLDDPFFSTVFSLQAQLVRREVFCAVGGFDESYEWAELTEFFLRCAEHVGVDRVGFVSAPLYRYFRRAESHSTQRDQLERMRVQALRAAASRAGVRVDGLRYAGRSSRTGAQHYRLEVAGRVHTPPYACDFDLALEACT